MKANSEASGLKPIGKPATLALADLTPSPGNRSIPKDDELKGLASSIRNVGLLYPIIVRRDDDQEGRYRIVAGERRWRAMRMLRLESAPCVVLSQNEDGGQAEIVRVVENHQRRNLEPLEEAAAVRGLLDLGLDPETVSRSLGRSRAWVARRASLTELTEAWLAEIRNHDSRIATWPPSHLEVISRFPAETQDRMLDQFRYSWQRNVPGFRDLVGLTGQFLHVLSAAPWKLEDDTLCPEAGACGACPKRSSHMPDLFAGDLDAEEGKTTRGDQCLDADCWSAKAAVFLNRKAGDLRREHAGLVLLNNSNDEGEDGAALEDTFQTEVLNASEVAASRKSDENAVPALVVNGPGLGRVRWVQPVHSPRGDEKKGGNGNGSNGGGAPAVPGYPIPERTIEQKREPYDRRRRQVVIDAVRDRLNTLYGAESAGAALALEGGATLARNGMAVRGVFLLTMLLNERGWRNQADPTGLCVKDGPAWDELARLRNHDLGTGETRESVMAMVWSLIRLALNCLRSRLALGPYEKENTPPYLEAEILCAMLGLDIGALRAEAARTVPYAKAWRDEAQDGWAGTEDQTGEREEMAAVAGSESQ